MAFNPYAATAVTGEIRSGVRRFLDKKEGLQLAEATRQRQLEDEQRQLNQQMGLARFRADLDEEKYKQRRQSDTDYQIGLYAPPVEGRPESRRWKPTPDGKGWASETKEIKDETGKVIGWESGPIEEIIPAVEARPAGPLYMRDDLRHDYSQEDIQLRGDLSARNKQLRPAGSPGGRNPRGSTGNSEPVDGQGLTPQDVRDLKFNNDEINAARAKQRSLDANSPEYAALDQKIAGHEESKTVIGRKATYRLAQQAKTSPATPQTTTATTPASNPRRSSAITNKVRYAISKGQSTEDIQRDIDSLPDAREREIATQALRQLAPKK